jgi:iron complex transport system substrate-binding protein
MKLISRSLLLRVVIVIFLLFIGFACRQPTAGDKPSGVAGDSASSPDRSIVKYAHGFTIDYFDHYKEVKILNRSGGRMDTLDYLLVPQGMAIPAGHPSAQVIFTPVQSLIVMSSMHVAQSDFVGVADRIIGLGNGHYVNSTIVREGITSGKIKLVGMDANLNNEQVITLHPGVLMTMSNPESAFGQYKTLIDAGIPVLPNAEWLETTPLGRAEWVKLVGALTDREAFVNRKFDSVEQAYRTNRDNRQRSGCKAFGHHRDAL